MVLYRWYRSGCTLPVVRIRRDDLRTHSTQALRARAHARNYVPYVVHTKQKKEPTWKFCCENCTIRTQNSAHKKQLCHCVRGKELNCTFLVHYHELERFLDIERKAISLDKRNFLFIWSLIIPGLVRWTTKFKTPTTRLRKPVGVQVRTRAGAFEVG